MHSCDVCRRARYEPRLEAQANVRHERIHDFGDCESENDSLENTRDTEYEETHSNENTRDTEYEETHSNEEWINYEYAIPENENDLEINANTEIQYHLKDNEETFTNLWEANKRFSETDDSKNSIQSHDNIQNEIGEDGKWIIKTYTGYIATLQVQLNKDRPHFQTKQAEQMWDRANEINLKRLKRQVQTGEYFPDDALLEVDPNPLIAPTNSEEKYLKSEKKRRETIENWKCKKVKILEREMEMVDLVLQIREHFSQCHRMEHGLNLMKTMLNLEVTPLMLKKNPFVIDTFRYMCHYAGMNELSVLTDAITVIQEIRSMAQEIYDKLQLLFTVPTGVTFEDYFKEQSTFMWRIFRFEEDRVYHLMNDPLFPNSK